MLLFALACCLLTGFQPTIVSEYLHPGLTEPDLLTLDQWEELEAEYGPAENWVDGLGPEPSVIRSGRPEVYRKPLQVHFDAKHEPAKSFWVDPVWWSECLPAIRNRLFA